MKETYSLSTFTYRASMFVCACVCVEKDIQKRSTDYLDAFVHIQIRAKKHYICEK